MRTKTGRFPEPEPLTWLSCAKVLIQVSTTFSMRAWWFCVLQETRVSRGGP